MEPLIQTVLRDVYIARRHLARPPALFYAIRCQYDNHYRPIQLVFEAINNCFVRIPSVLMLRGPQLNPETIQTEFRERIPRHIGNHVFLRWHTLSHCKTFVTPQGVYDSNNASQVNSIYPVLRANHVQEYRLCLGLLFRHTLGPGDREFDSLVSEQQNMQGSHNITERIFESPVYQPLIQSLHNSEYFAIYVCGGARLIVDDDRTVGRDIVSAALRSQLTKSYFQPGSFVIFEGSLEFSIQCAIEGRPLTSMNFAQAVQNQTIFPPNIRQNIQQWFNPMRNRFVIFLGYHESTNGTSCWRLQTRHNRSIAQLEIPDGGYIAAIEPWVWGWTEIYWRHRYERLCEAVVSPIPVVPGMEFAVPNENIMNRILGSGQYQRSSPLQRDFTVQLQDYIPDQTMRFSPVFADLRLATVCERTALRYAGIAPPLVPPFMPPFKLGLNTLYYSMPGDIVAIDPITRQYQIGGHNYKLSFGRFSEYQWSEPMELAKHFKANIPFNQLNSRVGIDMRVYHRNDFQKIGETETYFFEKVY